LDHNLIEVSQVEHNESGSSQVTVSMSGLIVNDLDFLNLIGAKANWQGRLARLWWYVVDENEAQIGEVYNYYTGYMNDITINGGPDSQTVSMTIEHYLASLADAGNKTYLMQKDFDSGDESAAAAIASANGTTGSGLINSSLLTVQDRLKNIRI